MYDKELIKKNFKKSLLTYDDNAIVQKKMAKKLLSELPCDNFDDILEIGSYSGILTKEIIRAIDYRTYLAIDIIDCYDSIKNLDSRIDFKNVDIENFEIEKKFDLIIANASLQWCSNLEKTILELKLHLKKNGILAISIFGENNFYEIRNTFDVGLNYPSENDIKKIFSKKAKIIKEKEILEFKNPKEILKHIKYTGVNSISKTNLKISEIKEKMQILDKIYKNKLTYEPLYIIDFE